MNDGEERYGAGPSNVRVILPLVVADDLEEGAPDLLVVGLAYAATSSGGSDRRRWFARGTAQ